MRERIDKGKEYLVYGARREDCISCKLMGKCYKGNRKGREGRTIMVYKDRGFMEEYDNILKENEDVYKKRKQIIEPVIGFIKSVLRVRRFLLRGIEKVRSEWILVATAFNLLKFHRLLIGSG